MQIHINDFAEQQIIYDNVFIYLQWNRMPLLKPALSSNCTFVRGIHRSRWILLTKCQYSTVLWVMCVPSPPLIGVVWQITGSSTAFSATKKIPKINNTGHLGDQSTGNRWIPHKEFVMRNAFGLTTYTHTITIVSTSTHCHSLQWRHNGCDGVSNHWRLDCLLFHLFRRRPKKTSKLLVTGLCEGNSPVTGEFPEQRASNAECVSIWWRHHGKKCSNKQHMIWHI